MAERRRRYWGIWLLGDLLSFEGIVGVFTNVPAGGWVIQGTIAVVGVILIVVGVVGDYR